jgi:DNA-directed RNA polymerase specialized sigma24 family protein
MTPADSVDDLTTETLLRALVALAVDQREADFQKDSGRRKTEILLSDAGLGPRQIATLVGKKEGAVAKAILRARKSGAAKPGAEGNGD